MQNVNPTTALLHHVTGMYNVAMGWKALAYTKSNKLFPTYMLMQKVWNKVRQHRILLALLVIALFGTMGTIRGFNHCHVVQVGSSMVSHVWCTTF